MSSSFISVIRRNVPHLAVVRQGQGSPFFPNTKYQMDTWVIKYCPASRAFVVYRSAVGRVCWT